MTLIGQQPFRNLSIAQRQLMAEIGPNWGNDMRRYRDMVLAAYAPLLQQSPKNGIDVTRDISYGPHQRHRLDIFRPKNAGQLPVVLFVHGGAFVRGAKSSDDGIYDNVLYWFARHGCLGINVEYRLAPEAKFPAGAEDVSAAVAWTRSKAAIYGGNPDRLLLVGHSSGATHIASFATDPVVTAKPGPEVAGLVLISGRLRVDALPENPNANGVRSYFGDDVEKYETLSPVNTAHLCRHRVMIAVAQYDNPLLDVYGMEYGWRIAASTGRAPRFIQMQGHNHSSMAMHFDSGEDDLGNEILDFFGTNA